MLRDIEHAAELAPDAPGLIGIDRALTYRQLMEAIEKASRHIERQGYTCMALLADNSPDWIVLDLAALKAKVCMVPLPTFFSNGQLRNILEAVRPDVVLVDSVQTTRISHILPSYYPLGACPPGFAAFGHHNPTGDERSYAKLTFTSGTTGNPKGVRLAEETIAAVVCSLRSVVGIHSHDRHLCLMPLSTLLENIAGVYLPLSVGASVSVRAMHSLGIEGARVVHAGKLAASIIHAQPTTMITTPASLSAIVDQVEQHHSRPATLRYVAVGGAPVPISLLERADAAGLPAYQGYGLSECASVVSLNTPDGNRPGSAGKVLPHLDVAVVNQEIVVSGTCFSGYVGDPPRKIVRWQTGDYGHIDADGYLYLTGQRRGILVTSDGRNVDPTWVEQVLTSEPAITAAAVSCEDNDITALIETSDCHTAAAAVTEANSRLPGYARVRRFSFTETITTKEKTHEVT